MKYRTLFPTLALVFIFVMNGISQERHLISFEIKDQLDKVYTDKDYDDQLIVVVGSDKSGKKYNPIWSDAILDAFENQEQKNQINIIGIANLKGVPFFLKGMIKGKFPKDHDNRILMDWKGQFAKAYLFESKVCNILVFDRNGTLVLKTHGKDIETHKLSAIVSKLNDIIYKGIAGSK